MPAYDAEKRRATKIRPSRRERGVWLYVPAAELAKLKPALREAPPYYKVRAREGGNTVQVYFYLES